MFDTKEVAETVDPAVAPTVMAPSAGIPSAVRSTAPPSSTGTRTTVLPRLELVGDQPTLVVDEKRRFEPIRPLGQGGVGEVMGVHDNDIGRPVALKRLRPDVQSPSTLARFVDEIRTIGRLEHPNIIPIHDVGLDEAGQYYFVMKYVDGETLEAIIDKLKKGDQDYHRRYPFERRVQIFADILDAMTFAHDKGIIHRDIKPANVMIGPHGEVMVMDWGIAKSLREPSPAEHIFPILGPAQEGRAFETRVGTVIGTPAYMSPEQAMGEKLTERSDIYSLSVLFYELLGLTHPSSMKPTLTETLRAVVEEEPPMLYALNSPYQRRVPMDLAWFVHKGLFKDPKNRFASVEEMRGRLLRRAEGYIEVQCAGTLVKMLLRRFGRLVDQHPNLSFSLVIGTVAMVLWALGTTIYRAALM